MNPFPYGLCPICGAPGVRRERRPNGNDTCENGHVYPSAQAKPHTPVAVTPCPADLGPLVIACVGHSTSEDFRALLGLRADVIVLPFAATLLSHCGEGTKLPRGLVAIRPKPGSDVSVKAFDGWVETSILPYLAPGVLKMWL
jgi:hypothetical protein